MPLTEAQKAALDAGREKRHQKQQKPETEKQQAQPAIRYAYVARTRLKVGDSYREPGEEIPEAASWLNLHAYLDLDQIEEVPVLGDQVPHRQERAITTLAPEGYDEMDQARLRRLQEEREHEQRTGKLPGTAERHPGPGLIELDCRNCRTLNYLTEADATSETRFHCWRCRDLQSVQEAMSYPPQSRAEYNRQIAVNQVDKRQPIGIRPGPVRQRPSSDSHIDANTPIDPRNPIPGRR